MKTISEIVTWLQQPDHISITLVEISSVKVQGSPTTLYLSSKAYTTTGSDSPANTIYDPCIRSGISFNESLSLDGSASIGYGDIELDNTGGVRDNWLNYVWANRNINIYVGDPRWPKADFYLVFSGVVSDISARDANSINIIILDKLERLNRPIYEEVLGGSGNNKDAIKPLLFGECFNIEPLRMDTVPNSLKYMIHDGPIESIIEVRDNGLPVLYTANLAEGTFELSRSPAGQITCSAQGYKPGGFYTNNIATLIRNIVVEYGPANMRLDAFDIDDVTFDTFETNNTQPVGIYCKDKENTLDVCQQLAASVGASVTFNSQGLLSLVKLDMDGSGTNHTLTPEDVEYNTTNISEKPSVIGSVKLNFNKNWSVQNADTLAGGLPSHHATAFTQEWKVTSGGIDTVVIADYKIIEQPDPVDTMLLTSATAETEATRRLNMWKVPRYILTFVCFGHMMGLSIGDTIDMTGYRFGLDIGKSGLVISTDRDWINNRITIGVLI